MTGELKDAELHRAFSRLPVEQLDLVVLDERVGEQALAHRSSWRGVLDVELDQPADVDVRDLGEPERGQRPLDGRSLRVEDAGLRTDQYAGSHEVAPVRSSQAWNGSPTIRS